MKFKPLALTTVLLTAATAWAHHGAAEFDQANSIHLSGTITKTEWVNPHVLIHLQVTGADGKMTDWVVECPPPNWMKRQGLTQSGLDAETKLDIDGYPAKDGSNRINVANVAAITRKDGTLTLTVGKGPQYTRLPQAGLGTTR